MASSRRIPGYPDVLQGRAAAEVLIGRHTLRWPKVYGSLYGAWDGVAAVRRRPAGGVFVAGTSMSSGAEGDRIVMRYTASRSPTTIRRLGLLDGAYTDLYDVAVASDGNVIVAGSWEVTDTEYDFYVASFTEASAVNWSHLDDSGLGHGRAARRRSAGAAAGRAG